MSNITKITVGSTTYDIKDANAQETLVSGTNIKTINSTSILGSGDITVGGLGYLDIYPVGTIYQTTNTSFSPSTTFGGTWTLVGTRLTVDSRVYGNGKSIGFTDGTDFRSLGSRSYNGSYVWWSNTLNSNVAISGGNDSAFPTGDTKNYHIVGVPTKAQITAQGTGYEDATGLTTDYITCNIWERTA